MTTKTLIVGGYGAVGREAAAGLAGHTEVVVAGRNPDRAKHAHAIRLDLRDPAQIDAALDGVDAVLMCVETGNARLARACLDRGIGYADITATPSVIAELERVHVADAPAVLSVGIAPGVTNLLARHVSDLAPGEPVRIGVLLGSGERHGTAAVAWTVDGLGQEQGSWTADFPAPFGRRTVHRFPFSDQHTLKLPDVRTGLALDSRSSTALLGAANRPAVARFLKSPAIRPLTDRLFGGLHLGSDGFAVIAEAGGVRASFTGHGQSRATGLVAAHVIRRLPALNPGVAHLEDLVDPTEFLTALTADGFELQLPQHLKNSRDVGPMLGR
ncbi:saccharopine dehydrogenase NADP-binding domain-containing protein [Actinoplanes xinjiangensis]|uniref:Saccharopine dehydrogenase-like protein n=1 Tax=Actinoplanes xinjiangensis TaxID=512350 RepID=A0A316FFA8_9ACTN|nr:saccharopine dehydrogenase NADP-binding domain-containing protein [Actinoplanes xinjiangensis]PWK47611.1 saccharopine dehydrogenase-like protein [Actinoplanes xinjiangensis]